MKQKTQQILEQLIAHTPALASCEPDIRAAAELLIACYRGGGKVMTCGNGGSAADADHIVGELMKGFRLKRPVSAQVRRELSEQNPELGDYYADRLQGALPAISLVQHTALLSAFTNDVAGDMAFAQQVFGYGVRGDLLLALSTSGASQNVLNAARVAKARGIVTVALTGARPGPLCALCDAAVMVPETETFLVQELHLPVYHALCAMTEQEFYEE